MKPRTQMEQLMYDALQQILEIHYETMNGKRKTEVKAKAKIAELAAAALEKVDKYELPKWPDSKVYVQIVDSTGVKYGHSYYMDRVDLHVIDRENISKLQLEQRYMAGMFEKCMHHMAVERTKQHGTDNK